MLLFFIQGRVKFSSFKRDLERDHHHQEQELSGRDEAKSHRNRIGMRVSSTVNSCLSLGDEKREIVGEGSFFRISFGSSIT